MSSQCIKSFKRAATLLSILACLAFEAQAATPYAQAISDFQARKYAQALSGFQNASRSNPSDPLCHYYMALCYQYMNQVGLACKEYQWVASNSRDLKLKAQAQAGLTQLSRYQSQRAQSGSSSTGAKGAGTNSNLRSGSAGPGAQAQASSSFARGRLKVLEFSTSWCGPCKAFAPIFHHVAGSSKYSSRCEFQSLDAEDPANVSLVQKYGIKGYPTTVFADANGVQVDRLEGGTNESGLSSKLDNALSKLPR